MQVFSRTAFILLVTCALLFPKMSAVVMDLMPSIQTMVICTGDRLIILRIDANGDPIEDVETITEHCIIADALVTASIAEPMWQSLSRSFQHIFAINLNTAADMERLRTKHLSRAPPVLT